ncbi:hypothetical protein C8A00DRAFT_11901, partial [Chaetomidium leptoderma]
GLEEKVVVLDGVVSGLWGVVGGGEDKGSNGGRYERVVRAFEEWVGGVERVFQRRRGRPGGCREEQQQQQQTEEDDGELVLIGEMDAAWRAECAALVRRLEEWRRKLSELGDVPPAAASSTTEGESSSLGRILAGCRALVHGMLAELEVMEQIEREAVAEEMRWVREMNRRVGEDAPRAGAIWRGL